MRKSANDYLTHTLGKMILKPENRDDKIQLSIKIL